MLKFILAALAAVLFALPASAQNEPCWLSKKWTGFKTGHPKIHKVVVIGTAPVWVSVRTGYRTCVWAGEAGQPLMPFFQLSAAAFSAGAQGRILVKGLN